MERSENHMSNLLSVMHMIEVLFMNIDSLKTKNWDNFLASLRLMMPYMSVYDNTNYSRWLSVFWMQMKTLSEEHTHLIKDIFSQSLTRNSYSFLPSDL